ncbi:hypothetical protein GCM10009836_47300 [Pseudonocardia ailaonensis]|uniref:Uncharacterized protein n=1 Tax=Pseudonocardia ailaonensis TaxID=367279 RepID=A0ABN2NBR6_9PSEU
MSVAATRARPAAAGREQQGGDQDRDGRRESRAHATPESPKVRSTKGVWSAIADSSIGFGPVSRIGWTEVP